MFCLFANEALLHCVHQMPFRPMLQNDGFPLLCKISQHKDIVHCSSPVPDNMSFEILNETAHWISPYYGAAVKWSQKWPTLENYFSMDFDHRVPKFCT